MPGPRRSPSGRTWCRGSSATVPRPAVQGGERQRLGGEQVDPPARCGIASSDRAQASARGGMDMPLRVSRSRAPATGTSTVTSSGVEARRGGPLDQRHRPVAVLPHVELKPVAAAGVGLRRRPSMDAVPMVDRTNGMPAAPAAVGSGDLALGLHQPGEAGRARSRTAGATWCPAHAAPVLTGGYVAQDGRAGTRCRGNACRARVSDRFGFGGAVGVVEARPTGVARRLAIAAQDTSWSARLRVASRAFAFSFAAS